MANNAKFKSKSINKRWVLLETRKRMDGSWWWKREAQFFLFAQFITERRVTEGCVYDDDVTKTKKAESEAQRGKPKGTLESESRNAIL